MGSEMCIRDRGYFAADSDSSMALFGDQAPHHLVLNRIVSLKEDAGKSK